MTDRKRLANRRLAESFTFEVAGLRYTCTVGRFRGGSIGELFLSNHKGNSAADNNARDAAITLAEVIRHALCRDANGRASGRARRRAGHRCGAAAMTRRAEPEAEIQRCVFRHFRTRSAPGVFAFHPANGGYRRPVEATMKKGRRQLLTATLATIFSISHDEHYGRRSDCTGRRRLSGPVCCQC